jgi:hypothetical protein
VQWLLWWFACLGGPAVAGPVGPVETFEGNPVGSFPAGWSDAVLVDPTNTAPKPSASVVSATDAFGNPTKALATLPGVLPSGLDHRSARRRPGLL